MHFEVLVEDQSGKKALDILIPKIKCLGSLQKRRHLRDMGTLGRCSISRRRKRVEKEWAESSR